MSIATRLGKLTPALTPRWRASLKVRAGSFDAWLGETATACPAWAGGFEVRPDAEAARVEADRGHLERLRQSPAGMPLLRSPGADLALSSGSVTKLVEGMERRLCEGLLLRWHDLRGIEIVLDELAAVFGGEDVLKPFTRQILEDAGRCSPSTVAYYADPPELTDPADDSLEDIRALVERGSRSYVG